MEHKFQIGVFALLLVLTGCDAGSKGTEQPLVKEPVVAAEETANKSNVPESALKDEALDPYDEEEGIAPDEGEMDNPPDEEEEIPPEEDEGMSDLPEEEMTDDSSYEGEESLPSDDYENESEPVD